VKTQIQKMFIGLLVLFPATVGAQPQVAPTAPVKPTVIQLTLHPAPLVGLPFRYRLLPDMEDLEPGNAAPLYLLACSRNLMVGADNKDNNTAMEEMESLAPDKIDRARAKKLIAAFGFALRHLELGARRELCHWDLPERTEGFNTLLPHLGEMRMLSRLLSLQAKVQIADGKYDDAAHTLQTGMAMARHLDSEAFEIQQLVAAAVMESMLTRVEQWIATPGSPNLYWAVTDLPSPYLDLRSALRFERANAYRSMPHLKEAVDGKLTAEHFRELSAKWIQLHEDMGKASEIHDNPVAAPAINDVGALTPKAKTALREMGYTDKALEAMAPEQLIGLWWGQSYERAFEESTKALSLPLHQDPYMPWTDGSPEKKLPRDPSNPLLEMLPTIRNARLSVTRVDRHIGQLRCLEMIRAYAAVHDGSAPETLAAIPGIPVAVDPATGLPYQYHVDAGTIVIEAPIPPGGQARHAWKFEIKLEK